MHHQQIEQFFLYARERYSIFQRRQAGSGWPGKPWTHDPILQQYRFCNVFREDDKVTVWFRDKVRNPMRWNPDVAWACLLFRFTNRIQTGEQLERAGLFRWDNWNQALFRSVLEQCKPMLGAAYMIKTPNGMDKIAGLTKIFQTVHDDKDFKSNVFACVTLEQLVERLEAYPFIGRFMAYEIACDLMHTGLFTPMDRDSWANPGPGAKRGLARLQDRYGRLEDSSLIGRQKEATMLEQMRSLLEYAGNVAYWFGHWPRWDMRTVEHTLCEYDKYMRAHHGEGTPKQKFEGT